MKIISLKPSRSGNLLHLGLEDGTVLPISADDAVRLSLSRFLNLSPEELSRLYLLSASFQLREYALRQIALSPKTAAILSQKLLHHFYKIKTRCRLPDLDYRQIIDKIITDLQDKGLVSESEYVNFFLHRHSGKSRRHLELLLKKQGVKVILPAAADDLSKIKKIIAKSRYQPTDLRDFKTKNKLFSSLYRRGFSLDDIRRAVDDFCHSG